MQQLTHALPNYRGLGLNGQHKNAPLTPAIHFPMAR
jgi:hypothetical protein